MNDLILARQHCNCEASYTLIIDCSIAHKLIASLGDLVMVVRCALILGDLPRLDPGDWPRRAVRDFYLRQLRDWKGSADIDTMSPSVITIYARVCAATLARAHARSGDRIAIASYLGNSDVFDQAMADFSSAYADQNERDYQALAQAVEYGRIVAQTGL
jgi:hypothetical protein